MKIRLPTILLVVLLLVAALAAAYLLSFRSNDATPLTTRPNSVPQVQPPLPPDARQLETAHYLIHSSASEQQTIRVAESVEALHAAYTRFFADMSVVRRDRPKLQIVLYRDQAEFKAHNKSSPWAEAYYLPPRSHAYYSVGDNSVHWMIHEATHQLNREVTLLPKKRWSDEGLAAYFGSSWIEGGTLTPGRIDPAAYTIWWLPTLPLTGDLQDDISTGKIIPLRAIISGEGGPDINRNVNLYYIEYWSLTHFLLHYQDGKYATQYRELIANGSSLEDFERLIGPVARLQQEWYAYLQAVANEVSKHSASR